MPFRLRLEQRRELDAFRQANPSLAPGLLIPHYGKLHEIRCVCRLTVVRLPAKHFPQPSELTRGLSQTTANMGRVNQPDGRIRKNRIWLWR